MNERFVYVSSLGFCIIASYFILFDIKKLFKNSTIGWGLLVVLIIGYSGKTVSRNKAWTSNLTLATTDALTSVNGAKSQTMAGGLLLEKAQATANPSEKQQLLMQSVSHLKQAIAIYPNYIDPILLMGNAQYELYKNPKQALVFYYDILAINPSHANAHQNIQFVIEKVSDPAERIKWYEQYVSRAKDPSSIYFKIGNLYGQQLNNLPKAIENLKNAYALLPTNVDIVTNLTTALSLNKQFDESIQILNESIAKSPNNPQYYMNLGMNYFELGEIEKAKTSFDTAVRLNPKLDRSQFPV
jgi:tetratricopeptide (TPR) repeat protein